MNRSDFLKTSAAIAGSSLLPTLSFAETSGTDNEKKKTIRFAHITDTHLKSGIIPEKGFAKALHHLQQHSSKVDFIINGGDSIMDSLEASKEKTQQQWDLFKTTLQREN